ncbi:hypothetical protein WJX81_002831 [Elliptochloris bilobata]|uniref:Uncharacterized protein n=1 Tax=Elliptochloris bilobata TaxID=381761 RepID=A0AAW1QTP7_9CHLO
MASALDVAKRLDFQDMSGVLPQALPRESILQALAEPSVASLRRAFKMVNAMQEARVASVLATAKEQAAGSGESDLRRLRRQFSSLKNTFCLYDTKENFINGLMERLPDGTEEARLQVLEAEVERQVAALKQAKAQNRQAEAAALQMLERLRAAQAEYAAQREALSAQLNDLSSSVAEANTAAVSAAAARDAAVAGLGSERLDEAAERTKMVAAAAETRVHEAAIVAQEAEAAELQAAIRSEEDELQSLQAQIEHAKAAAAATASKAAAAGPAAPRFAGALEWCEGLDALLAALGGVHLEAVGRDELRLRLAVHADAAWEPALGTAMASAEYGLVLRLQPGGTAVAGASLAPPEVAVDDIVAAAQGRPQAPGFVVREVRARLAQRARRGALIKDAAASFPLRPAADSAEDIIAAELPGFGSGSSGDIVVAHALEELRAGDKRARAGGITELLSPAMSEAAEALVGPRAWA